MPLSIIQPGFILVVQMDNLGLYITLKQQGQIYVYYNLSSVVSRLNVTPQTVLQLSWCFRKAFLITFNFLTSCATKMKADRED